MKNKNILISAALLATLFISGCSSMSVLSAPNGKDYYIDLKTCERYTLVRDTLFCYDKDTELETQYNPVTFGYKIETRRSY